MLLMIQLTSPVSGSCSVPYPLCFMPYKVYKLPMTKLFVFYFLLCSDLPLMS